MEFKIYHELPKEAMYIRDTVFVKEQGFVDEYDEIDGRAVNGVMYDGEKPMGTFRYFHPDESNDTLFAIGRIAILKEYRGTGAGLLLMEEAKRLIEEDGGTEIVLSAQYRVSGFYEKCGYKKEGEIYLDQDCPHIKMRMKIKDC